MVRIIMMKKDMEYKTWYKTKSARLNKFVYLIS